MALKYSKSYLNYISTHIQNAINGQRCYNVSLGGLAFVCVLEFTGPTVYTHV